MAQRPLPLGLKNKTRKLLTFMEIQKFNPEKVISRLQFFNYNYEHKDSTIKIFLPLLCYLKIRYSENKIRISSHLQFGFRSLPLEFNFLIYAVALFLMAWYKWTELNRGFFILLGLLVIHFVICFIKIESLRTIIHNWIEKDSPSEKHQ